MIFLLSLSAPILGSAGLAFYYASGLLLAYLFFFVLRRKCPIRAASLFLPFNVLVIAISIPQSLVFRHISDNTQDSLRLIAFATICIGCYASLSSLKKPQITICFLWSIVLLLAGGLGLYEMISGFRFPSPYFDSLPEKVYGSIFLGSASVFGNPNTFASFLLLSFPFMELGSVNAIKQREKLLFSSLGYASLILVFLTVSRLACVLAGALLLYKFSVYMLSSTGALPPYVSVIIKSFILIACTFLVFYFLANVVNFSRSSLLVSRIADQLDGANDTSTDMRLAIYYSSLELSASSGFLGLGVGRFAEGLISFLPAGKELVGSPHFVLLEMLVELGLLPFVLFCAWLYETWKAFRNYPLRYINCADIHSFLIVSPFLRFTWIPIFVLSSFLGSGMLNQPFFWLNISSIAVIADICIRDKTNFMKFDLTANH
ncbi:O-antigen ligase family protein [Cyanobium sp. Maggiore-St4-Cus]|uniref:O-antigen ligase family protein n=1 Tax=Cyanobium sp. Maggiore-St4-Cus TaxID=2823717 RepID=UPI0020CC72A4|nr:O-antigen ligase family protein [Cyanobium sp. Maggiore-St4-Cus]MCP9788989.1 O-antigen ligase family protein [Cyanobium sp. Maggiore-St4-Cus]